MAENKPTFKRPDKPEAKPIDVNAEMSLAYHRRAEEKAAEKKKRWGYGLVLDEDD